MPVFPTLRFGNEGPSVRILQMDLYGLDYNYNGLQINGVFDSLTNEVVRDFQAENRLVVDGIVGPATWSALFRKVLQIQSMLNQIGFVSGSPDGIYGPRTTDAVKRFQSVNGLNIVGVVNPRTREKIFNPNPTDDYRTRPTSPDLSSLHPYVARLANQLLNACSANNLNVIVYTAFRSWYDQDQLYALGRTQPGNIVTDAEGGGSYHNWGLAFDCAPIENGIVAWEDTNAFLTMGRLGQQIGLEWGGNWTTFAVDVVDMPHFQYNFGLSIDDLCEGKRPPNIVP